jgi:phosphoribosylformylglycinamidine cyclo-ligase
MRAMQPFVYRIEAPGKPQPVFEYIKDHAGVDLVEMYGNYNMGAGFAVYVDPRDVDDTLLAGSIANIPTWHAGNVHEEGERKAVEIERLGITFEAESMNLR